MSSIRIHALISYYKGNINVKHRRYLCHLTTRIFKKLIFYNKRFNIPGDMYYTELRNQNYVYYHTVKYIDYRILLLTKFHVLRLRNNVIIDLCRGCIDPVLIHGLRYIGISGTCEYCGKLAITYSINNIRQIRPKLDG